MNTISLLRQKINTLGIISPVNEDTVEQVIKPVLSNLDKKVLFGLGCCGGISILALIFILLIIRKYLTEENPEADYYYTEEDRNLRQE